MDVKGIIQFTLWDRGLGGFFPSSLHRPPMVRIVIAIANFSSD